MLLVKISDKNIFVKLKGEKDLKMLRKQLKYAISLS